MTYTVLAVLAVGVVVLADLAVFRTTLLRRRVFWTAYAIVLGFQLLTNAMFTGTGIVRYDGSAIIGSSSPSSGPPPFLGDGRIAFAPVEDLLFGFALVLLTLVLWMWWGRRGVQRQPAAGPPRWWFAAPDGADPRLSRGGAESRPGRTPSADAPQAPGPAG